jgi:hypothetical protein
LEGLVFEILEYNVLSEENHRLHFVFMSLRFEHLQATYSEHSILGSSNVFSMFQERRDMKDRNTARNLRVGAKEKDRTHVWECVLVLAEESHVLWTFTFSGNSAEENQMQEKSRQRMREVYRTYLRLPNHVLIICE